nr:MAG TPA: ChiA1-BD-binding domain protein [Caudoviricetes sp.]
MKRSEAGAIINAVVALRNGADDQTAARNVVAFPAWAAGKSYAVGERVKDEGKLYKVLTTHTSQTDWKPKNTPSLYTEILPGQGGTDIGEWVQPESTNPYMKGDKVKHGGKVWVSTIDNNVWEPGATGTESLWTEVK